MRWLSVLLLFLLFLGVAYATPWGAMAIWFKMPGPESIRYLIAGAYGVLGLVTLIAFFTSARWRWIAVFSASFLALLLWWNSLEPAADGNWSPEVARQVTGTIEGDILTLQNMRAFDWRSSDDFTAAWVGRSFDLSQIESLDLLMSYWDGPDMAHLMLSFGFTTGEYLVWSVEVRRSIGETFSPVADFFKANSVSVVAGTEEDIVGLRSNIQKAEVFLFRLQSDPARRRKLLEGYVEEANQLAERPAFFNSVFTNCSKTVIDLARSVGAQLPADWRVIVNGYFPEYLFELGAMNSSYDYEELRRLGNITPRAQAFGLREGFSQAIREGVPAP